MMIDVADLLEQLARRYHRELAALAINAKHRRVINKDGDQLRFVASVVRAGAMSAGDGYDWCEAGITNLLRHMSILLAQTRTGQQGNSAESASALQPPSSDLLPSRLEQTCTATVVGPTGRILRCNHRLFHSGSHAAGPNGQIVWDADVYAAPGRAER